MKFLFGVLCALALLSPATTRAQNLPGCFNYQGQQVPCTGTLGVDAAGKPLLGGANAISGTLTTSGSASAAIQLRGPFNATVSYVGTSGTALVLVERSFDAGATWAMAHAFRIVANAYVGDNTNAGMTSLSDSLSLTFSEPEYGVRYRVRLFDSTVTSVTYRLSQ